MDRFVIKTKTSAKTDQNEVLIRSSLVSEEEEKEDDIGNIASNNENNDENKKKISSKGTKRKFRMEWVNKFSWLQEKDTKSYCIACEKTLLNHFTHLKKHDSNSHHLQNIKRKKNQIKIESYVDEKNKFEKQVHLAELTLVMFIITHNLPFLLMDFLPNLLAECCPDSKIAKSLKCARTKSTKIAETLGKKAEEKIISTLKTTKFSLIVDETTDLSTKKSLVLVVRYVDKLSKLVHDRFLGLLEIVKSDADSLFETIKNFFFEHEIPINNLIGLATDGANVMAGENKSLKANFKKDLNLFFMKCTCHSLHLCSAYACKKIPLEIEKLCRNIYKFFSYSPKRINEFREFQEYCSVKPNKILGISQTRWLALEHVINRIVEQWDALKLYFISNYLEVNGIIAADMAKLMDNPGYKVYFLFLSYILKIMNNLNKEFQSEKIRLPYLYSHLEMTFKLISSNIFKNSFVQSIDFLALAELNIYDKNNYLPVENIFIGIHAETYLEKNNIMNSEKIKIKTNIRSFYLELLNQIKLRFDFQNDEIKNLSIITPQNFLSDSELSILPLLSKFSHLIECDPEIIITQWKLLQFSNHGLKSDMDINEFWEKVSRIENGLNEGCFKELSNFVFNLLSLPHSSAAAERKFSDLNLIKNKLRNKLEFSTINNIMLAKELKSKKHDPHYVWSARYEFE